MKRFFRIRIRTALILIALVAIFLAWRCRDPEASTAAAISNAGGRVHLGYQNPQIGSSSHISVGMLPDYMYFSQYDLSLSSDAVEPRMSISEILLGPTNSHRVRAIELKLNQCTPELMLQLEQLQNLNIILIEMPGITARGSDDAKQLAAIKQRFGDRVWPTVNQGF